MASVPCAVGMINTAWLSKEVVGMEHLPLGGSLGAVKEFVTHLRRQDTSSYLFSVINQHVQSVKLLPDA